MMYNGLLQHGPLSHSSRHVDMHELHAHGDCVQDRIRTPSLSGLDAACLPLECAQNVRAVRHKVANGVQLCERPRVLRVTDV
jgi:hypothetical protein